MSDRIVTKLGKMPVKYLGLTLVLCLFFVSVIVRSPYLNKPLDWRHGWITAHTLIAIENLNNYPPSKHLFRLVGTYPEKVNKHIKQGTLIRQVDHDGIGYYTTYPPFAAIWAYSLFWLFSMTTNTLNIQTLSLIHHGISSLAIFYIVYTLSSHNKLIASLSAAAIYIFATPNLWFYGITYSWDTIWHHFAILNLLAINLFIKSKCPKQQQILFVLIGILNMITIYTEFQGVFFTIALLISLYLFKITYHKLLSILIASTSLIPLAIHLYQVGRINGIPTYIKLMHGKVNEYATQNISDTYSQTFTHIWQMYHHLLVPSLLLCVVFLALSGLNKSKNYLDKNQLFILLTITITTLLHYSLLFRDVLTHEFTSLKLIILISFTSGFIISTIVITSIKKNLIIYSIILTATSIFAIQSTKVFKDIFAYPDNNMTDTAGIIADDLKSDEVMFIISNKPAPPQINYYLKRNHLQISRPEDAYAHLTKYGLEKGRIFYLIDGWFVDENTPITIAQQSPYNP